MTTINNISLYIPHIFVNYSASRISDIFESQNIGKVKNVDLIEKMGKDNKPYNAAYIHFDRWYNNASSRSFQERVLDTDREARIMYDDPWFWIVLPNTTKKHPVSGNRKIRLDITTPPSTPPPSRSNAVYPDAPKKVTYSSVVANRPVTNCPSDAEMMAEMEEQMDDVDAALECEDQFLTTVDSRYIYTIEQENQCLRYQLAVLQDTIMRSQTKV